MPSFSPLISVTSKMSSLYCCTYSMETGYTSQPSSAMECSALADGSTPALSMIADSGMPLTFTLAM